MGRAIQPSRKALVVEVEARGETASEGRGIPFIAARPAAAATRLLRLCL